MCSRGPPRHVWLLEARSHLERGFQPEGGAEDQPETTTEQLAQPTAEQSSSHVSVTDPSAEQYKDGSVDHELLPGEVLPSQEEQPFADADGLPTPTRQRKSIFDHIAIAFGAPDPGAGADQAEEQLEEQPDPAGGDQEQPEPATSGSSEPSRGSSEPSRASGQEDVYEDHVVPRPSVRFRVEDESGRVRVSAAEADPASATEEMASPENEKDQPFHENLADWFSKAGKDTHGFFSVVAGHADRHWRNLTKGVDGVGEEEEVVEESAGGSSSHRVEEMPRRQRISKRPIVTTEESYFGEEPVWSMHGSSGAANEDLDDLLARFEERNEKFFKSLDHHAASEDTAPPTGGKVVGPRGPPPDPPSIIPMPSAGTTSDQAFEGTVTEKSASSKRAPSSPKRISQRPAPGENSKPAGPGTPGADIPIPGARNSRSSNPNSIIVPNMTSATKQPAPAQRRSRKKRATIGGGPGASLMMTPKNTQHSDEDDLTMQAIIDRDYPESAKLRAKQAELRRQEEEEWQRPGSSRRPKYYSETQTQTQIVEDIEKNKGRALRNVEKRESRVAEVEGVCAVP